MKRFNLIGIAGCLLLASCSDHDQQANKYLVEARSYQQFDAGLLKDFVSHSGLSLSNNLVQYDAEVFKVTYHTHYKEQMINASGLVILPDVAEPIGIISFQHGTITASNEAPTTVSPSSQVNFLYAGLASNGFVVVVPDYLGFGASAQIMHPYYVERATAEPIIDNILAARELALMKGLTLNGKLFLAGYSQGGYATMATHKALEELPAAELDLVASFPASGGYDVKAMQDYFFHQTEYADPYYLAYVALSYKTYYGWDEPLSDFFQEPYAAEIPSLFDGTKSGGAINASLTTTVGDLIQPDLLADIDTDTKYKYLVDAFVENSLTDWVPQHPMIMFHGTADTTVPYGNSATTFEKLIDNGTSPYVLSFEQLEGADHAGGVIPYLESFVPLLILMK